MSQALTAIIEGFPAGLFRFPLKLCGKIWTDGGKDAGRGGRMNIESDEVSILSGGSVMV